MTRCHTPPHDARYRRTRREYSANCAAECVVAADVGEQARQRPAQAGSSASRPAGLQRFVGHPAGPLDVARAAQCGGQDDVRLDGVPRRAEHRRQTRRHVRRGRRRPRRRRGPWPARRSPTPAAPAAGQTPRRAGMRPTPHRALAAVTARTPRTDPHPARRRPARSSASAPGLDISCRERTCPAVSGAGTRHASRAGAETTHGCCAPSEATDRCSGRARPRPGRQTRCRSGPARRRRPRATTIRAVRGRCRQRPAARVVPEGGVSQAQQLSWPARRRLWSSLATLSTSTRIPVLAARIPRCGNQHWLTVGGADVTVDVNCLLSARKYCGTTQLVSEQRKRGSLARTAGRFR